MSKKVILDNGHGGIINNVYQTPGKRSPNWDKGILYRYEFGVTKFYRHYTKNQ